MPSIAVRSMGTNYDPLEGNGLSDFVYDIEAVAQIIGSTLRLFLGEWWENLQAGTPMFQSILGQSNASNTNVIATLLQQRIYKVPFVLEITQLSCTYKPANRSLAFTASVITEFGTIVVNNGVD